MANRAMSVFACAGGGQFMRRPLSAREREKLAGEIAALQSLDLEQLRSRWWKLYESEPPRRFSRDLLIRAVAYRTQERALGGLTPQTRRLFQRIAAEVHARRPLRFAPTRKLGQGAVLIREWGGVKHRITVLESGFSFRDKHYRSLSAVARHITGSRWSGPLFFGLRNRLTSEGVDGAC
jgi:Protein of unknown function (DUF2924)